MNKKVLRGVVAFFDAKKGWGFITPDDGDKDYFVQFSHLIMDGFKTLKENQVVEFEIGTNHKGECATNVKVIK